MKSFQITLSGNTHGRGIRFGAMHAAYNLGIKGTVQYSLAGDIIMEAEGDEGQLDQFVEWCRNSYASPPALCIAIREGEVKGYQSFDILHVERGKDLPDADSKTSNPGKAFLNKIFHLFT
jgi:acylphosphatase